MNEPRWSRQIDACWAGLVVGTMALSVFVNVVATGEIRTFSLVSMMWPAFGGALLIGSIWGLTRYYRRDPVVARAFSRISMAELLLIPAVLLGLAIVLVPTINSVVLAPVLGAITLWALVDANRRGIVAPSRRLPLVVGNVSFTFGLMFTGLAVLLLVVRAFHGFAIDWLVRVYSPWGHSYATNTIMLSIRWSLWIFLPVGYLVRRLALRFSFASASGGDDTEDTGFIATLKRWRPRLSLLTVLVAAMVMGVVVWASVQKIEYSFGPDTQGVRHRGWKMGWPLSYKWEKAQRHDEALPGGFTQTVSSVERDQALWRLWINLLAALALAVVIAAPVDLLAHMLREPNGRAIERRRIRFSLRTMLMLLIVAGSAINLWYSRASWVVIHTFNLPGEPTVIGTSKSSRTFYIEHSGGKEYWDVAKLEPILGKKIQIPHKATKWSRGMTKTYRRNLNFFAPGVKGVAIDDVGGTTELAPYIWVYTIGLRHGPSPRHIATIRGHGHPITILLLFPNDRHMASASANGVVRLWERRRPEYWWGVAWLPEFWLTLAITLALLWSLRRDWKSLGVAQPQGESPLTDGESVGRDAPARAPAGE